MARLADAARGARLAGEGFLQEPERCSGPRSPLAGRRCILNIPLLVTAKLAHSVPPLSLAHCERVGVMEGS